VAYQLKTIRHIHKQTLSVWRRLMQRIGRRTVPRSYSWTRLNAPR